MTKRLRGWLVVVVILIGVGGVEAWRGVQRERARTAPIQAFRLADLGDQDRVTIDEENDRNYGWRRFAIRGSVPPTATLQQGVAEEVAIDLSREEVAALDRAVERHRTGAASGSCARKTRLKLFWDFDGHDTVPEDTHWTCATDVIDSLYARGAARVSDSARARREARAADEPARDAGAATPAAVEAEPGARAIDGRE